MKRLNPALALIAAAIIPRAHAQLPSGSDINTAIPIYYNQMVTDLGDSGTAPLHVYSITVAKGQQISATLTIASTATGANLEVLVFAPTSTSIANCRWNACGGSLAAGGPGPNTHSVTFTYTASTSGVHYIAVAIGSLSVNYTLEVTTTSIPPTPPPPPCAGTLAGQVDYITYSLQLIAAGLPDSASIGGTQMCASCTAKQPSNPQIVEKMEKAMSLNLPVSACYDAAGNVFQITLKHP